MEYWIFIIYNIHLPHKSISQMWINIAYMEHLGYIFSMFWLWTIGATSQAPQASATSTLIGHKRRCSSFGTKLVHMFFFPGFDGKHPGERALGYIRSENSLNLLLYSQRSRKKNDILWKSHLKTQGDKSWVAMSCIWVSQISHDIPGTNHWTNREGHPLRPPLIVTQRAPKGATTPNGSAAHELFRFFGSNESLAVPGRDGCRLAGGTTNELDNAGAGYPPKTTGVESELAAFLVKIVSCFYFIPYIRYLRWWLSRFF